ncbi:acyl-CoA synthetase [Parvibium lacunae]|uniref:AMP-binding protein n=1 Tax=Parvibium lacunae TaxID=1888893 RepID=A0A368L3U8_9BURK|nr:AMP-binding protein [Parvibium lacunae]RCS58092.1 AMP-binding protein [Parvibium lacunae]
MPPVPSNPTLSKRLPSASNIPIQPHDVAANEQSVKFTAPSIPGADAYAQLYNHFGWAVPEFFNLAEVCCRRWQDKPQRIALFLENEAGQRSTISYGELGQRANQLSVALQRLGVKRGDRVALCCPQTAEVAVTHIAVYQLGAVVVPLSHLFGPDALQVRLSLSGAKVLISHHSTLPALAALAAGDLRSQFETLEHHIVIGGEYEGSLRWHDLLARSPIHFDAVETRAEEPALLLFTSGTTGQPKGALLPHRVLLGNLPGFVASQNWFPQPQDRFWTPADWAWTGGLMDGLLPTLYFGMPIVGFHGRFTPARTLDLLQRYRITNTFLFPTALKMLMREYPDLSPQAQPCALRAIMSAGEAVGGVVCDWVEQAFGVPLNVMFGQTEMNYLIGDSAYCWPSRKGSMGRAYPGHRIALLDERGAPVKPGQIGEIAVCTHDLQGHPDPIFFLGYWQDNAATQKKFCGNHANHSPPAPRQARWCRTGDLARQDEAGYFWYQGRTDDVFKAAGYRISPAEIENCLLQHPAVANVAIVPSPDSLRGHVVKAFIVLAAGYHGDEDLQAALQAHVRDKLAPYEYPKRIEFVNSLPLTATGKVQRHTLRAQESASKLIASE